MAQKSLSQLQNAYNGRLEDCSRSHELCFRSMKRRSQLGILQVDLMAAITPASDGIPRLPPKIMIMHRRAVLLRYSSYISVCDIYQASLHPSNQPQSNSTYLCLCEGPSLESHLVSWSLTRPAFRTPTDSYMDDLEPPIHPKKHDFSRKKSQVNTGRTCNLHSGANQISSNTCGEKMPVTY